MEMMVIYLMLEVMTDDALDCITIGRHELILVICPPEPVCIQRPSLPLLHTF